MFSTFIYDYFPIIIVKLKGVINNDLEYNTFENNFIELNENKKEYMFIFDTIEIGLINVKYCYKLSSFISNLKRRNKNYLKKSIIIISNDYVKTLLDIVFFIQKPISTIYLTKIKLESLYNSFNYIYNNDIEKIIQVCSKIEP